MSFCLALVSGKGGTGKSSISCGLAVAFAKRKLKVLLVDLDIGLPSLDIFFGVEKDVVFDLSDALTSRDFESAFYYPENYENICIVPAPPKNKEIDKNLFTDFIETSKNLFDVVIIDMSAGLDFSLTEDIKNLKYICVSNPDPVSIRDASVVSDKFDDKKEKPLLIINKFDIALMKNGTYKNFDSLVDISKIQLLGVVPISNELMLFPITKKIGRFGDTYNALKRITGRLCGERILLPNPKNI